MEKKKIIIVVAVIVILIILAVLGVGFMKGNSTGTNNENKVTQNGSNNEANTDDSRENEKINLIENINKDVIEISDFELRDVKLEYKDGETNFSALVHNKSKNDYKDGINMLISFYDENNSLIFAAPMITGTIMAEEDTIISTTITLDCSNAKNIEIEVVK